MILNSLSFAEDQILAGSSIWRKVIKKYRICEKDVNIKYIFIRDEQTELELEDEQNIRNGYYTRT